MPRTVLGDNARPLVRGRDRGAVFGDEVLAAAILDRLLHHSHTLMIQGGSYRLKQEKKDGLLGRTPPSRS